MAIFQVIFLTSPTTEITQKYVEQSFEGKMLFKECPWF